MGWTSLVAAALVVLRCLRRKILRALHYDLEKIPLFEALSELLRVQEYFFLRVVSVMHLESQNQLLYVS